MILNATEAVYQWLLFVRGKNGGIVRNRGFSHKNEKKTDPAHFSPNCTDPAHFVLPLFCEKALKISDTRQNASER